MEPQTSSDRDFPLNYTEAEERCDEESQFLKPKNSTEQIPLTSIGEDEDLVPLRLETQIGTWKKAFILFAICFSSATTHFVAHMLGPLKDTLKTNLDINNTQFGLLQSSLSLIPTFFPFIGGVFLDAFGAEYSAIFASTLVVSGQAVLALGAVALNFELMVLGLFAVGAGNGWMVMISEAIVVKFFRGRSLSLMIGILIAIGKMSSFLAAGLTLHIASAFKYFGGVFWFSTGLCLLSWIMMLSYVIFVRTVAVKSSGPSLPKHRHINFKKILHFSDTVWVYLFLGMLFDAVWAPFLHLSSNMIKVQFDTNDIVAAWHSSISFVLPAILNPFLGIFLDRFGKRCSILTIASVFLLLSVVLVHHPVNQNPVWPMLFFAASLSFGPLPLVTSVPLLFPTDEHIGTALGIHRCLDSIGATLMDTVTGVIQDKDSAQGYSGVLTLLTLLSVMCFIGSIGFWWMDKVFEDGILEAGVLTRNSKLKSKAIANSLAHSRPPAGRTIIYAGFSFVAFIVCWLVFWWVNCEVAFRT
ncbi:MFS general substrate transporter [Basidiobolus meristosporus CBS 931.73]|uniref:Lysosomal dipeptide transporter MFSD1 n=1 Tax=Basidiobolus meristosporus CBS 931.73 TaxID=1314790 RepID=A0A1Y1Y6U2_9FUNG|nr:MFS general substrate transporter [Basidiobolus meristosporus CBS 931.73]|eukprot:ORX93733.1 MFS general substrate transporter [Basidiobolus meristosporus CBS 931.73]